MKKATVTGLVLILVIFSGIAVAGLSHIQIFCEPGIKISLNGQYKGLTIESQGGLMLTNISPGRYAITAEKAGYNPQSYEVNLGQDDIKEVRVTFQKPDTSVTNEGNAEEITLKKKVGNLRIKSIPIGCDIQIPDLGINQRKTHEGIYFENLDQGVHNATFSAMGKTLNHAIVIADGQTSEYMINFVDGVVYNLNEQVSFPVDTPTGGWQGQGPEAQTVLNLVMQWAQAQSNRDFNTYKSFYSRNFTGIKRTKSGKTTSYTYDGWLQDREKMIAKTSWLSVTAHGLEVTSQSENEITVKFTQYYRSDRYSDVGPKILNFRKESGGWKISYEEMLWAVAL